MSAQTKLAEEILRLMDKGMKTMTPQQIENAEKTFHRITDEVRGKMVRLGRVLMQGIR